MQPNGSAVVLILFFACECPCCVEKRYFVHVCTENILSWYLFIPFSKTDWHSQTSVYPPSFLAVVFLRITRISLSLTFSTTLSFLEYLLKHFHIPEPKQPPVFDQPLQPAAAVEGDTLQLACHVQGSQPIRIQWLKAGREIRASDRCNFSFANGVALLELAAVTKSDSGEYVCKASNAAGTDTCKSKVTVKGRVTWRKSRHMVEI